MSNKIILGLVGEMASGKSTVADLLATEFNSETASFSAPLRQILDILELPQDRKNMIWLGVDLRTRFGQDILAKYTFRIAMNSSAPMVCLPNIRLGSDLDVFKNLPHFYLVNIEAEAKTRYQRLIQRRENPDDATKTWEEFVSDSNLPTEIFIRKLAKQAQFSINNNTCQANLFKQIRSIIQEIRGD